MSRNNAYVRFPDGTVRYTLFHNTVDQVFGALFDSPNEAWDRLRPDDGSRPAEPFPDPVGPVEPVLVWEDMGGRMWRSTAARNAVAGPWSVDCLTDAEEERIGLERCPQPEWATYPPKGSE